MSGWAQIHKNVKMSKSMLSPETVTLNAVKLKNKIIEALLHSTSYHYYSTAITAKFGLKNCDETDLTMMFRDYMSKVAKNNEYTSQSGYLIFENEQLFN